MATEFLDKAFSREFRDTTRKLRASNSFTVDNLSIPEGVFKVEPLLQVYIDGIQDEYFSKLNKQYIGWIKKTTVTRNIYWNNGQVKKKELYHSSADSILVWTDINLNLPFKYSSKTDGLEYVDFRRLHNTKTDAYETYYCYSIPKEYCYKVNNTALVISDKRRPKHHGGVRLVSISGYTFYLYVVNRKGLKEISTQHIIKSGISPIDMLEVDIPNLVSYWTDTGEIFNPDDLQLDIPIDNFGSTNLAYTKYDPTLDYEERGDLSMKQDKDISRDLSDI